MSSVVISGDTSGAITVSAPAVAGTNTLTLQAATATNAVNTLDTAKAYNWNGLTTNTSLEFTSLPSWIKKITVMLSGLSVNGTSNLQIQLGSGSFTTSGYTATNGLINASATNYASQASGFFIGVTSNALDTFSGAVTISLLTSNTFVEQGCVTRTNSAATQFSSGVIALGGTLDRVRITTTGSDTFDAGSVNILYEG